MRLVKIPMRDLKSALFINADQVTQLYVYPYPEDTAYWEVTITLSDGTYYERRFREYDLAVSFMAEIAGIFNDTMAGMLQ